MEKMFATTKETTFYNPIAKIITAYTMTQKSAYSFVNVIPEDDRAMIAYYLSLQFMRTKEFREKIIELNERGTELIMKKLLREEVDKDFLNSVKVKVKESRINLMHNQYLMDYEMVEGFAASFLSHIWFIAVNETNEGFWTSDNPLVLKGHLGHNGIKSKGIEIVFPITPKLALVMRDLAFFEKDIGRYNKFIEVDRAYVEYCNSLQVYQSYRNVFSKESNFPQAFEILKSNPELRNMDRNRFLMG